MAPGLRERVMIVAGAAAALTVGAHLFVVEPLLVRAREVNTSVPAREATLERRRLLVSQRPRLIEELAAIDERLESETVRLLRGPTPPLAASELQKLVKELLTAGSGPAGSLPVVGLAVRSERVLPPADHDGLQEVGIELTVVGSIRDIAAALARLERTDRLLALKDVKIRVMAPGQPRELLTTLTVAGYLLPAVGS